jgi:hypothetical protein
MSTSASAVLDSLDFKTLGYTYVLEEKTGLHLNYCISFKTVAMTLIEAADNFAAFLHLAALLLLPSPKMIPPLTSSNQITLFPLFSSPRNTKLDD